MLYRKNPQLLHPQKFTISPPSTLDRRLYLFWDKQTSTFTHFGRVKRTLERVHNRFVSTSSAAPLATSGLQWMIGEQTAALQPPSDAAAVTARSVLTAGQKRSVEQQATIVNGEEANGLGVLAAHAQALEELAQLQPVSQRPRVGASYIEHVTLTHSVPRRKPRVGRQFQATELPEPQPQPETK